MCGKEKKIRKVKVLILQGNKVSCYIYSVKNTTIKIVVGKKHQSARAKTERWSGYSLEFCICWPKGNVQVCVFARGEFVFSSQEAYTCSFTFTLACL